MENVSMLLYGAPMSGKTTLASQFPKPAVLSLDGNAKYARKPDGSKSFDPADIYNVSGLEELDLQFKKIIKNNDKYETLIIDTADLIENMVRYKVLDDAGIDDESEANDYGRTWRLIREGFKKLISQMIFKFKGSVIILAWEDEKIELDNLKREITTYVPRFNSKVLPEITGLMAIVARAKKIESNGTIHYGISIGDKETELGGTRIPVKKRLIESSYENFVNNFKEN